MSERRKKFRKDEIAAEAAKFSKRSHFRSGSQAKYHAAKRYGWLDEVCAHMDVRKNWTYEAVKEEALKYATRTEFSRGSAGAYNRALKMKWLDDVGAHLKKVSNDARSFDEVQREAAKYQYRSEFKERAYGYYLRAQRSGWLDAVCAHMDFRSDNGKLHCVYLIINERLNQAYVGITRQNVWKRFREHKSARNKTTSKEISQLEDTEFKQLTDYIYDTRDVRKFAEQKFIDEYKKLGFEILNSEKAVGSVGYSEVIWTFEALVEEAKKYHTRKEFADKNASAYVSARHHEKRDDIFNKIELTRNYWDLETVRELARGYKTRADFKRACGSAYHYARQNKILEDVCSHMKDQLVSWNESSVLEVALKCSTVTDFMRKYSGAYKWVIRNNKSDEMFAHMNQKQESWTEEKVREVALKCSTRSMFSSQFGSAYAWARSNGVLDQICSHMRNGRKNAKKWDLETIKAEALKYSNRTAFKEGSGGAYRRALRTGILDDVCQHMENVDRSQE